MTRRFVWLLGWAVDSDRFGRLVQAAFPADRHALIASTPAWLRTLGTAGPQDWFVGYSLGALLLLRDAAAAPPTAGRAQVALLAPFWAFAAEDGAGGRVARAALRALRQKAARDPASAVEGFARLAGVPDLVGAAGGDELLWGLEQLAGPRVPPVLPDGWLAIAGDADPLLDGAALQRLIPRLTVVPGAAHHPGPLLAELRRQIEGAPRP